MSSSGAAPGAARPSEQDLLDLATEAAWQAGHLLVAERPANLQVALTKTSPTDIVTDMDRRSEESIAAHLLGARPGDGLLGEETGSQGPPGPAPAGQVRWVVDPIDGTVNYLYGLPHWAVSVAAEASGEVVAGVVYAPILGHTWTATAHGPARCDGVPVHASSVTELDQALIATGFGYQATQRAWQGRLVAWLLPQIRDIRRAGAASLDLCAVANGWVDGYYESGLALWDMAAGALIARRAGALVGGLAGAPAGPDMVIAAPPRLFDALETLVRIGLADAREPGGHKPGRRNVASPQPGVSTGGHDDGD